MVAAVWQKLEEQNPDFFRAYYSRLKVKEQMLSFNSLLDDHLHLLHTFCRTTPTPPPQRHSPAPGVPASSESFCPTSLRVPVSHSCSG